MFLCKGKGFLNVDEFLSVVNEVKNLKDMGNYDVFVECLRLYDNFENGLMRSADLERILTTFGNYYYILKCDQN